jgi:hypothetical protein
MSFYAFRCLSPVVQLYWVLHHGTYLAQRWDEEIGVVNLYHCADEGRGFFVEVGLEEDQDCFVIVRSFTGAAPLEEYTRRVQLPRE